MTENWGIFFNINLNLYILAYVTPPFPTLAPVMMMVDDDYKKKVAYVHILYALNK